VCEAFTVRRKRKSADFAAAKVRVERRGKGSPGDWRQTAAVNSIRSNTVEREQRLARPLSGGGLSPSVTMGLDRWLPKALIAIKPQASWQKAL